MEAFYPLISYFHKHVSLTVIIIIIIIIIINRNLKNVPIIDELSNATSSLFAPFTV